MIKTLQKNVTTSGTPVPLAADTALNIGMPVIIKAKVGNTGAIFVGKDAMDANHSGSAYFKLEPGEVLKAKIENLNQVYIDSAVNGEGVEVLYEGDFIPKVTTYPLGWGEDATIEVQRIEGFLYNRTRVTADALVASGAGFVHHIIISPLTATPTAGKFSLYDSITEAAPVIHDEWLKATDGAHPIPIGAAFTTGLYAGFDASLANFAVEIFWRNND